MNLDAFMSERITKKNFHTKEQFCIYVVLVMVSIAAIKLFTKNNLGRKEFISLCSFISQSIIKEARAGLLFHLSHEEAASASLYSPLFSPSAHLSVSLCSSPLSPYHLSPSLP